MSVDSRAAGVTPRLLFTAPCATQGGSDTPTALALRKQLCVPPSSVESLALSL